MVALEQCAYEHVIAAAESIVEHLPRLTKALESIASDMSKQNTPPEIYESAMGPGDDEEEPPF